MNKPDFNIIFIVFFIIACICALPFAIKHDIEFDKRFEKTYNVNMYDVRLFLKQYNLYPADFEKSESVRKRYKLWQEGKISFSKKQSTSSGFVTGMAVGGMMK